MERTTLIDKQIWSLCRRVEETFGMKATTPSHFEQLAGLIFERTGELLSPTTLKRLWGYINESTVPRKSTLNILASSCGWRGFDEFVKGNTPEIESGFVGARVLNAEKELQPGEIVRVMWQPARVCVIKYLGKSNWVVVSSEGTRLSAGDTFTCPMIIAGEPLYLDNVSHDGSRPGVYVCGRNHGITFARCH